MQVYNTVISEELLCSQGVTACNQYDWKLVDQFKPFILTEESSQTNVILQYKLLSSIKSAVCSVIQQSMYVLHFYYRLYDEKYGSKITTH